MKLRAWLTSAAGGGMQLALTAVTAVMAVIGGVGGIAVLGGILARPAAAQLPLPIGGQALANLTTEGAQDESVVAIDPNGNFLVVWRDEFLDGSASAIIGRRFSARTGQPLSGEFLINLTTDGDQRNPAIAIADDGRFVVVWEGPDTFSTLTPGIFGSLRAANGAAIAAEFPINANVGGAQRRPAVAMQPGGAFLIAWQDEVPVGLTRGVTSQEISARIYPANFPSAPPGNPFRVNVNTDGDQEEPAVAALPATGGWLVGWQGPRQFSPPIPMILARVLAANGSASGELEMNTSQTGVQRSHVALAANGQGEAAAVWEAPDASFRGIYARRIVDGVPLNSEEQVNLTTSRDEREPSVAIDERGGFVTVWVSEPPPTPWGEESPEGSPIIIQGRKKSGSALAGLDEPQVPPLDGEFQINTSGLALADPWVAAEPRGTFIVAWQGAEAADPLNKSAYYRGFRDALFADDFETGTTARWSATLP